MKKIITVAIKKGGTGKTTLSINLCKALVILGQKVLLVDVDSQCNATMACGISPYEKHPTILSLLTHSDLHIADTIIHTSSGIDIIPADKNLSQAELVMNPRQLHILSSRLKTLQPESYDYVIIDTPPSDQYLTSSALIAATHVLIPLQLQKFAFSALNDALQIIEEIVENYNPTLNILGIVPSMVVKNTNITQIVMDKLHADYPNMLLPYTIYSSVAIQEAQLMGCPLYDYQPMHPAIETYNQLAKHIISQ